MSKYSVDFQILKNDGTVIPSEDILRNSDNAGEVIPYEFIELDKYGCISDYYIVGDKVFDGFDRSMQVGKVLHKQREDTEMSKTKGLTFREAMQAMLDGKKVRKTEWLYKHSYIHFDGDQIVDYGGWRRDFDKNDIDAEWELYEEPRKPAEFEVWYNDKTGEIVPVLTKEPGDFRLIKVKEVVDDNE